MVHSARIEMVSFMVSLVAASGYVAGFLVHSSTFLQDEYMQAEIQKTGNRDLFSSP